MFLMLEDLEILYFDFNDFVVKPIINELLPFYLRDSFTEDNSYKSILSNVQRLKTWLSRRVLSLSRDNAKKLYALFSIPQSDDIETRVSICLKCKGVSINDSYWIKDDKESLNYSDINIRHKRFEELVNISLHDDLPSVTTSAINPELTTHGLFRKAWVRENGKLYLLKSDKHVNNINTRMEVLASSILRCFKNKIDCVDYTGEYRNNTYVSKCECFGNDLYSFVEAWELMDYCKRRNKSFEFDVLGYSYTSSSIAVIDYLISNTDRHDQNYGFWMYNKSGKVVYIAPIFDFNCALVSDVYNRDCSDTLSQMFNDTRTLKQLALHYAPYTKLELDYTSFEKLRKENISLDYVFDDILLRCEEVKIGKR